MGKVMRSQKWLARSKARLAALQALYQWQLARADLIDIEAQFRAINSMDKVDVDYFRRLLHQIPANLTTIEESLAPFIDRGPEHINPVERVVLWICAYELLNCLELPYKVILDESVALNREFGAEEGHRFVNGVLNNLARQVRAIEIKSS